MSLKVNIQPPRTLGVSIGGGGGEYALVTCTNSGTIDNSHMAFFYSDEECTEKINTANAGDTIYCKTPGAFGSGFCVYDYTNSVYLVSPQGVSHGQVFTITMPAGNVYSKLGER